MGFRFYSIALYTERRQYEFDGVQFAETIESILIELPAYKNTESNMV